MGTYVEQKMCCSPKCIYFPDVSCSTYDFIYDEKTGTKKRKYKKPYVCGYDGHIITNWYSPCPKDLEKEFGIIEDKKEKGKIKCEAKDKKIVLETKPAKKKRKSSKKKKILIADIKRKAEKNINLKALKNLF